MAVVRRIGVRVLRMLIVAALAGAVSAPVAAQEVTVLCNFEVDWCEAMKAAYEKTTLFGYRYLKNRIPNDEIILQNLRTLVGLLATLYNEQEKDPALPGLRAQELEAAAEAIEVAAGNSRYDRKRGRNRLTSLENRTISEATKLISLKSC